MAGKTRHGPPNTRFTWNDGEGTHEARTNAHGMFTPDTDAEEAHMVSLGWPIARSKAEPAQKPEPPPASTPDAPADVKE